ncbi:protein DYAD [Abrus precatorius]|uniref:Protein DYAD n=1 Tax=Abrus precatorius TaxID=3816 RepID=A0A8B8LK83_ABRPR|nr:protein DYAD [Abrus precatorius]
MALRCVLSITEEIPCGFFSAAAATEDMECSYLKKQENRDVHVEEGRNKKSPCLDKHGLLLPPASESICTFEASEHFKVGRFHEIDHCKLSPVSPVQLKSVRIVMVSDIGEHQVSLRYPSLQSLRTHFSDQNFGKPDGKKIPALDEKYVMGLDFAIKALNRSIPTEEFSHKRNSWGFWVSSSKENIQGSENPSLTDVNLISKQGSCWSQLKFPGMMQWGQRRQVRFLGRHEERKVETLPELCKEKVVSVEHIEGTSEKKRKKWKEETEAAKAESFGVMRMTRQCKRNDQNVSSSTGVSKSKKSNNDAKKQQLVLYSKNKRKILIDRWSAERYKLAEENMLKVLKAKGAAYGNPILRPDLRSEARKHIGDTGLLDHLLKHMAGKVAPGGAERFRRRHNAEGAMEYWLESADLVDIRREAGIQDPYWTPPPGWKLGDSISQDQVTSRELREIKEEILKLKQDMRELASKKGEEALAIVTTPSSCLSSLNSEDYVSLVPKQEIYAELVNKKTKIEEQLKEISLTLNGMEEQLGMLKPIVEEPIMSESVKPPALLSGPTSVAENIGGETRKEKKANKNKATKSVDTQMQENSTAEDKAAKIERLKSGFQICKPQGTFVWPNIGVSPNFVANLEDHSVVPTPSSASSSTTEAPKLVSKPQTDQHLPLPTPNPSSPVKPLAERRPVSTATLTHVTGPFSPRLSPPLGTPRSKVTSTVIKNASSINLNEAPLTPE